MSKKPDTHRNQGTEAGGDRANLDRQYRSIGISAVAAALPFVGKIRNPAKASARSEDSQRDRKRSVLSV